MFIVVFCLCFFFVLLFGLLLVVYAISFICFHHIQINVNCHRRYLALLTLPRLLLSAVAAVVFVACLHIYTYNRCGVLCLQLGTIQFTHKINDLLWDGEIYYTQTIARVSLVRIQTRFGLQSQLLLRRSRTGNSKRFAHSML